MDYKVSILMLVVGGAIAVGCSNQTRDEYSNAGSIAGKALSKDVATGEQEADVAAKKAQVSLAKDGVDAKKEEKQLENATMTPKIKSALASAANLHSAAIDVETIHHKIVLSGSVPSSEEKSRAGQVSSGIAGPDYTIKNDLTVVKS
jgi:hyperosmotically inducible protein